MRIAAAIVVGVMVVSTQVAIAADAPYIGKWKMNVAKSQLAGQTLLLEKTASGGMHYESGGFAYDFKVDGKEYPMPDGGTTSWKAVDANTWEVTNRRNGKVTANYRLILSGDALTFQSVLAKAGGGTLNESGKANRVSGGPGFAGRWRINDMKAAATTMDIAANGPDGVTLLMPEQGGVCKAKFDGKEYPLTGPFVGTGNTYTLKKTGPRSLEIVEKLNGKPTYTDNVSVSEDGKTLTFDSLAAGSHDAAKAVYDRAN